MRSQQEHKKHICHKKHFAKNKSLFKTDQRMRPRGGTIKTKRKLGHKQFRKTKKDACGSKAGLKHMAVFILL